MKSLRIVTNKEMGPVADFLNIRFTAFICRLAVEEGIEPQKMVEDARAILEDAEIEQEMKLLHNLDPDQIRDMQNELQEQFEYLLSVAELEAEDIAMEKYYEDKYNS